MGEDAGIMLVTQGYGPVAIIIPPVPIEGVRRPRIIYVDYDTAIGLEKLGLIQQSTQTITLAPLSTSKLAEIMIEVDRLGVAVPAEFKQLINKIIVSEKYTVELPSENVTMLKKSVAKIQLKNLPILTKDGTVLYIDVETIQKKLREYITAKDLIKLIDTLDEID